MPAIPRIPRLQIGIKAADDWINMIVDQIEASRNVTGSDGVSVRNFPHGTFIGLGKAFPFAIAQAGSGGIAARSSSTCGKGTVTLFSLTPASSSGDLNIDTQTVTVTAYNPFGTAVGANHYVIMVNWNNYWVIIAEDC